MRPRIITACVADRYANHNRERIAEISDAETGKGALVSVYRMDDGRLHISVYRCDAGVIVTGPSACDLAAALPSIAPHHSPTEHARAANRLVADIGGAE